MLNPLDGSACCIEAVGFRRRSVTYAPRCRDTVRCSRLYIAYWVVFVFAQTVGRHYTESFSKARAPRRGTVFQRNNYPPCPVESAPATRAFTGISVRDFARTPIEISYNLARVSLSVSTPPLTYATRLPKPSTPRAGWGPVIPYPSCTLSDNQTRIPRNISRHCVGAIHLSTYRFGGVWSQKDSRAVWRSVKRSSAGASRGTRASAYFLITQRRAGWESEAIRHRTFGVFVNNIIDIHDCGDNQPTNSTNRGRDSVRGE